MRYTRTGKTCVVRNSTHNIFRMLDNHSGAAYDGASRQQGLLCLEKARHLLPTQVTPDMFEPDEVHPPIISV